jgi:hypothetical protein
VLLLAVPILAQQTSSTDDSTPTGQAKGSPLGSHFGGSDLDKINLFNGNAAISLPLASSDGRSGMGTVVTLAYNSKFWRAVVDHPNQTSTEVFPVTDDWDGGLQLIPGWRVHAGIGYIRYGGTGSATVNGCKAYQATLSRVTFVAPDGTEYEFRDAVYGGKPVDNVSPACGPTTINRGKVFTTADGSAATFVSTTDIFDYNNAADSGPQPIHYISGTIYLRDGTRFTLIGGKVVQQQDRNGNRVGFDYNTGTGLLETITDTLSRQILIEYDVTESDGTKLLVRVTQMRDPSTSADDLVTRVVKKKLKNALRSDYLQGVDPSYEELWPGTASQGPYNPWVVERVVMASNHAWSFLYNRYGEVAEVKTPAGGRLQYDTEFGVGHVGTGTQAHFFRYVAVRRVYQSATGAEQGRTE